MSQCDEKDLSNLIVAFITGSGVVGSGDYLVQAQASPNNTVLVNTGRAYVPTTDGTMAYSTLLNATLNVTIPANSTGSTQIDAIVLYINLSASPDAAADNVATLADVRGTGGVAPTNAQILTAIGASNPYITLATVSVANGFVSITSGNITDQRSFTAISGGDKVFQSSFSNFVSSGLTIPTSASLSTTSVKGVIYFNGVKVNVASDGGHTYTANQDTYVDVSNTGVYTYNGVANGASAPGITANSIRIAKVVSSGSAITSVSQNGIDSAGNLIYPTLPIIQPPAISGASFTLSTNPLISQNTVTKIAFDTITYDLAGEFDATTNHRFTAKIGGIYLVTFTPHILALASGKELTSIIKVSGTGVAQGFSQSAGDNDVSGCVTTIINLTAGQYVEFFVNHDDTTSRNIQGNNVNTYAMINRLS